MDKILCPCGCGESFEPIVRGGKTWTAKKYFSYACANRERQRRFQARRKRLAKLNQKTLKFQPAVKPERRRKVRIPVDQEPEEKTLFA